MNQYKECTNTQKPSNRKEHSKYKAEMGNYIREMFWTCREGCKNISHTKGIGKSYVDSIILQVS